MGTISDFIQRLSVVLPKTMPTMCTGYYEGIQVNAWPPLVVKSVFPFLVEQIS